MSVGCSSVKMSAPGADVGTSLSPRGKSCGVYVTLLPLRPPPAHSRTRFMTSATTSSMHDSVDVQLSPLPLNVLAQTWHMTALAVCVGLLEARTKIRLKIRKELTRLKTIIQPKAGCSVGRATQWNPRYVEVLLREVVLHSLVETFRRFVRKTITKQLKPPYMATKMTVVTVALWALSRLMRVTLASRRT